MPLAPVTLIMPTYNRGALITQSLDSILAQTLPPAEIIVVDDGSSDGTAERLAVYGQKIRVISKENGGKSTALNLGLAKATQPLIWIFDDDDIAAPDALEHLVGALERDPEAGFAYGQIDKFFGDWPSPVTEPCISFRAENRASLYVKMLQDFFIWQGAMLVRAECYRAVGPFDVRFTRSQDYEMALRLLRRFSGVSVPRVLFHQRHHGGERGPSHARFDAKRMEEVWSKFNRLLFGEIYASHALEEFVLRDGTGPLSPREEMTGLLQRSAIMARKGVWDKAIADLEQVAPRIAAADGFALNAQEISGFRTVFEHGARSTFASLAEARAYRRAIDGLPAAVGVRVRGNLLLPVSNRIRTIPQRDRPGHDARQMLLVLAALAGPVAAREYLAARRVEHRHFGVVPLPATPARPSPAAQPA